MFKRVCRKSLVFISALVISSMIFAQQVNASKIIYVEKTYTCDQETAREMLDMVNDFRTGSDAWYWNTDSTTKTDLSGKLGELTYDYNLEAIAMQRAVELSVVFAHQCPDGSEITSISINGTTTCGENIFCGTPGAGDTVERAFNSWLEANANHAGQGHRRTMLGSNYNAIGIAHVIVDGNHYWVQEFGYSVSSSNTYTDPDQGTYTKGMNYNVDCTFYGGKTSNLMAFLDTGSLGSYYYVPYGQTRDLPGVNLWYTVANERTSSYPSSAYPYVTRPLYGAPAPESEYTVTWSSSDESIVTTDGSTYTVVGTGEATLTATIVDGSQTFTCNAYIKGNKVSLNSDDITVEFDQNSYTYTGSAITPGFTVKNGDTVLTEDVDYTVEYFSNTYASSNAMAILTAVDGSNYTDTKWAYFTISKAAMEDAQITLNTTSFTYNGSERKPTVSVYYNGKKLSSSYDYDVAFSDNINAGTATVTVTGKSNFQGTATASYTITPIALTSSNVTVSGLPASATYTGSEITSDITVKKGTTALAEGTDYDITFENNILPGTATVTIDFKGNYSGQVIKTFTINKVNVSNLTFSDVEDQMFDGMAHKPAVDVFFGDKKLTEGTDYTLTYKNGKDIGPASITVSGCGDCYTGSYVISYNVLARSIGDASVDPISDQVYTGSAITPLPVVGFNGEILTKDKDYTLTYSGNKNAGTATVTITGKGNFNGETSASFNITSKQLDSSNASISDMPSQAYTGESITPSITVKYGTTVLTEGTDYDITFENNMLPGTATVTIDFKGNYSGQVVKTFTINKVNVSNLTFSDVEDQMFDGMAHKPAVDVFFGDKKLTEGTDYTLTYKNGNDIGPASITVSGCGDCYTGSYVISYNVLAGSINDASVDPISDQVYTGSAITPLPVVGFNGEILTKDKDYTLTYSGNKNAGTATVTITGKGNFNGETSASFNITSKQLDSSNASISDIPDQVFTGESITPSITVKYGTTVLTSSDYDVVITDNTDAGTATITVTFKGNYAGQITGSFNIYVESGWKKIDKVWYYFNDSGYMVTGWLQISGSWYYFDSTGAMQTGWQKVDGKWYYLNAKGIMQTGWQKVGGKWYYLNTKGVMQTGWQKISGKWYYFGTDGIMKTKWQKISGKWYYFGTDGIMVTKNTKIGSKVYKFNSNGVCLNP